MHERVGLTAGSIWHYLTENGEISVAKLVDSLPEEEEIIQRSIGWLAQEDKITLSMVDKIETIALKGYFYDGETVNGVGTKNRTSTLKSDRNVNQAS
ncbi:winged helix-turn-helix domain-containing protein [Methylobacter svalbardensis]|uniref:winged helix-turn-helix domain-containing protein n=1 Tax=Methylobacter svalbardensis TaxID=3080016 RepID=UPI0030EE3C02